MNKFEILTGRTIGKTMVAGTEFPRYYQIKRTGTREYVVTLICNGIGESVEVVKSFKEAKELAF